MARTLIEVYLHIVFSTKHRANIIHHEIEAELHVPTLVSENCPPCAVTSPPARDLDEHGVAYDARYLWD